MEELHERMTIEEKVAQLLVVGFDGTEPDGEMERLVLERGIGGVILFAKNCPDPFTVHSLCRKLHGLALSSRNGIPLLICIDQEGGKVVRIKEGMTLFPGSEALGRIDSFRTTEAVARIAAKELHALGIQLNLAPVADMRVASGSWSTISNSTAGKTWAIRWASG